MPLKHYLLAGIILFWMSIPVFSQNTTYKNLVLEGGGIRGIAYGGALNELQARNILPGINRVAGTSAGAIQAAFWPLATRPRK